MNVLAQKNKFPFVFFALLANIVFAQTTLPLNYSPDGPINSIITKGDSLIVGG